MRMPARLQRASRGGILVVALYLAALCVPAAAQPVTSAGPDKVAVTVYRAPNRSSDEALNLGWLTGYALITESRRVTIPAGRSVIRFEGVAGGILPESAIVTGLPDGVREKNLDADLLSPRSLYARSYGRPVTLRRTVGDRVIEEEAIVRSGAEGAAILQTRDGFVAADCTPGEDETIVYHGVPDGLSAKPTLSIEVESSRGGTVALTLSYLAWGFDWQANYVATMRPNGRHADLFAWVTLANGDVTSFADAETMVVAGNIRREGERGYAPGNAAPLVLRCAVRPVARFGRPVAESDSIVAEDMAHFAPPPAPMAMRAEIVVTGARMAKLEELGDLKLYRFPDPTTVAANSQKQVALLERVSVPVDILYRANVYGNEASQPRITLRAQNREARGLGLPLPAGKVAVFQPRGDSRILVGEGAVADKAVNEEVEIEIADATQVTATIDKVASGEGWRDQLLTVTNANPFAVRFEADFQDRAWDEFRRIAPSQRLARKNGRDLWVVEVPANATRTLRFRLVDKPAE